MIKNKLIIVIIMLSFFSRCNQEKYSCFDWHLLEVYYSTKSSDDGYFEVGRNEITYFNNRSKKVEKYWLDGNMKVRKYGMYNWHYDTPKAYFIMNFSKDDCGILSTEGNPFFIESNIEGLDNVTNKDSLIFRINAAVTPFTKTMLTIYKKEKKRKTTVFFNQIEKNRFDFIDTGLKSGEFNYTFVYHLYNDDLKIISDSIDFYFDYISPAVRHKEK